MNTPNKLTLARIILSPIFMVFFLMDNVYCRALALLVPLSSGNFSSDTRFGLLAFPLIWPIAAWSQRGSGRRVYGLAVLGVVLIAALVLQIKYAYP